MRNVLLPIVVLLTVVVLLSGLWPALDFQEPLTLVTLIACLLLASRATPESVNPVSLMCFMVAIFLLGRFLSSYVFGHHNYQYADWFLSGQIAPGILAQMLAAITLFLCGITLGAGRIGPIKPREDPLLGRFAQLALLGLLPFAAYRAYINYQFWSQGDYLQLYLTGGPGGVVYVLGGWAVLAVLAYLASKPARVPATVALVVGIALCASETLKGTRGIALAEVIALGWLYATTQDIKISLWKVVPGGAMLIVFASYVERIRSGLGADTLGLANLGNTLLDFLFQQGTSMLFVVATLMNLSSFSVADGLASTFALFVDSFNRLFEAFPPGQSADFALTSASLPHRIAYMVNPEMYLAGNGMGGSAVAEAFLYARLFGPLLAGLFIGWVLRWLCLNADRSASALFVLAATLPFLFLTPRENLLYFVVPFLKACFFILALRLLATRRSATQYDT